MRTRRQWLRAVGAVGLVGGLAGCAGETETSQPGDTDATATEGDVGSTEGPVSGMSMGESVTYTNGDSELRLAAVSAAVHEILFGDENGELNSLGTDDVLVPSDRADDVFLLVKLVLENTGTEPLSYPRNFTFRSADGTEYERTPLEEDTDTVYAFPTVRKVPVEIPPGSERQIWVAFAVPPSTETGTLVSALEWNGFDGTRHEWGIDVSNLSRQSYHFDGLGADETARIEGARTGIALSAGGVREETGSFETTSSGESITVDPPEDGNKYALVDFSVENVGDRRLEPIKIRDTFLSGDGWETPPLSYTADDTYNRGAYGSLEPGESKAGTVLFVVPADAETYTFGAEVTKDITATWTLA